MEKERQAAPTINFKAMGKLLAPLELVPPEANASLPNATVMSEEFDAHIRRLVGRHQRKITLRDHASLEVGSDHANDGDGWDGGPVNPWNSQSYSLTVAYGKESKDYPKETLHQYLTFTSGHRYHADAPQNSRDRGIGVVFNFETIVPTVPAEPILCETFGIPFPIKKNDEPYRVKKIERTGELSSAETKRAFQLGLAVVEAWLRYT